MMMDTSKCAGCEAGHPVNKYGIHESWDAPSSVCERARAVAPWKCGCPEGQNVRNGPGLCMDCGRFPVRRPW